MFKFTVVCALFLAGCQESDHLDGKTSPSVAQQVHRGLPLAKRGLNPARVRADDPDWQRAEREVDAQQSSLEERLARLSSKDVAKYVLRSGPRDRANIALTFDDGPHPAFTLKILEILRTEGVPATFFVIGFMAEKYPDLLVAIKNAGHEVGNHTYSHVTLTKIPVEEVFIEYEAANDVVMRLTGRKVKYCRPPGGDFNWNVLKAAADLGLSTVLWTDDPGDYAEPADQKLYMREVSRLSNGAIVLLHDGSKNTLDTLARFIRTAKRAGFHFVNLDDLRGPSTGDPDRHSVLSEKGATDRL